MYKKNLVKDIQVYFYYKDNKTGMYHVMDRNVYDKSKYEYGHPISVLNHAEFKDLDSHSCYHLFKGYDASDAGLKKYRDDFQECVKQLFKNDTNVTVHYRQYYTHKIAVIQTFKRFCKGKYENHTLIRAKETKWFGKSPNGGQMFCEPGIYDCTGMDFRGFFPSLMVDNKFKIPSKNGKEKTINKLPQRRKVKPGFYRVKITSINPNAKKIFTFSKHHTYTHISLKFAMKNKKKFDFNIELIEEENNAYIYKKKDMVYCKDIFNDWYNNMMKLKLAFPKNMLVKHLMSSLWGALSEKNIITRTTEEQLTEGNYNWGMTDEFEWEAIEETYNRDGTSYYTLLKTENGFKHNIRLMPFLLALSRNKVAEIAMKDINNVVRIQTDNVTFKVKPSFPLPSNLLLEEKTSGHIEWINVNNCNHICPHCKQNYKFKEREKHNNKDCFNEYR